MNSGMTMRGRIDLKDHKLAGLHRMALRHQYRTAMPKCPDASYRQLWRIVNGAVRTTFRAHPEYLTPAGHDAAVQSLTKRIVGGLHGHATQVARSRSVAAGDALPVAAADVGSVRTTTPVSGSHRCKTMMIWARTFWDRARGGWLFAQSPEIQGARDD